MIFFCQSHGSLREVEFKNMFYFLFLFLIKMCGQALKILGKGNVDNKTIIVNEVSTIREKLGTQY